mgnify:CR=1 FL=1
MKQQKPLRQEVTEWKQHKVTKYLVEQLGEDLENLKEMWAAGQFTAPDQAGTIQMNSRAIGQIAGITAILDFVASDMDAEAPYEH